MTKKEFELFQFFSLLKVDFLPGIIAPQLMTSLFPLLSIKIGHHQLCSVSDGCLTDAATSRLFSWMLRPLRMTASASAAATAPAPIAPVVIEHRNTVLYACSMKVTNNVVVM